MSEIIKIVDGDILQATEKLVVHQVNCMGVMGGGIALQIRKQFPQVYDKYKRLCNDVNPELLLGTIQCVEIDLNKVFVNIFGQLNYGRSKQYTDYVALRKGLENVCSIAKQYNISVAVPYNIGCGLAGGSWPFVYSIIEDVFQNYDVTLYRWEV